MQTSPLVTSYSISNIASFDLKGGRGGEAMDAAFIMTMLNYLKIKNTNEREIW